MESSMDSPQISYSKLPNVLLAINGTETPTIEGSFVMVAPSPPTSKEGVVYLEGRIKDHFIPDPETIEKARRDIEAELSKPDRVFSTGTDLLADQTSARVFLGNAFENTQQFLECLNVIEHVGPATNENCYASSEVEVRVSLYSLNDCEEESESGLELHSTTLMPHANFEGLWEKLMYEGNLKTELIGLVSNMLKLSHLDIIQEMIPLILLYGLPGSGKTTLAQGLAQRVSIRLSRVYAKTTLVEIRTATLLSKYLGESGKKVGEIFSKIREMCEQDDERFICVLIDEVESIAGSRHSSLRGETQDSLRATNALLTGLDKSRELSNVIFLCTSNMLECLDAAFLDRCSFRIPVDPPKPSVQYEILRTRIQMLIDGKLIKSDCQLACYRDAVTEADSSDDDTTLYGGRVIRLVKLLEPGTSGRSLAQLPQKSIMRYLRHEQCTLDMALSFIEKTIRLECYGQDKGQSGNEDVKVVCPQKRKLSS